MIHVYFLRELAKWDLHKPRLKAGICFQLVMARFQQKKYARKSIPRGFKELLLKKEKVVD